MVNGYSHAIFQNTNGFRALALQVDKIENGGNNNGIIDGKEIQIFKKEVNNKYGYTFDFSQLDTIKTKKISVRDSKTREAYYNTTTEIAKEFGGATTTKTIDWLNNKKPGKDLLTYSTLSIDIPVMDNYEKNVENVNEQYKVALESKNKLDQENQVLDAKYQKKHWFRYNFLRISREEFEKSNERDY
ncbi:hypothetical protein IJD34_09160 [bacterium]|nr:hypothetical protein [bacterium]